MRALRNCDFCGADAAGAFEVVPPELDPTEDEQRRVVLCRDCKGQLEVLLEPLLARAGMEPTGTHRPSSSDATDVEATATSDSGDGDDGSGTVVAAADESTQKRTRTSSPNATVSGSDAGAEPRSEAESKADSDSPSARDSAATVTENGITFPDSGDDAGDDDESGDAADDDESEDATAVDAGAGTDADAGVDTGTDAEADDAVATGTDGESSSDEVGGGTAGDTETDEDTDADANADTDADADETDDSTPSRRSSAATRAPRGYGKVIRLLRNREFPMDRAAITELAGSAYDLEAHEVDAILEHAVENDEFDLQNGELREP